jgi:hypothetical protein
MTESELTLVPASGIKVEPPPTCDRCGRAMWWTFLGLDDRGVGIKDWRCPHTDEHDERSKR